MLLSLFEQNGRGKSSHDFPDFVGLLSNISSWPMIQRCAEILTLMMMPNFKVLQEDLSKLFQSSVDCQMLFNIDKCSVMHVWKSNIMVMNMLWWEVLTTEGKRDLK